MTIKDYKNTNKKILLTFIIMALAFTMFTLTLINSKFKDGTLYTMQGIVIEVDENTRLTTFVDDNGDYWRFYGIKDWGVNDIIKLTVNSRNTEDYHDDEVIGAEKISRRFKKRY